MRKLFLALALTIALSGCTTNGVYDPAKTWLLVGAVVVGAVAAGGGSDEVVEGENCFIQINPDGSSYEVCR